MDSHWPLVIINIQIALISLQLGVIIRQLSR